MLCGSDQHKSLWDSVKISLLTQFAELEKVTPTIVSS